MLATQEIRKTPRCLHKLQTEGFTVGHIVLYCRQINDSNYYLIDKYKYIYIMKHNECVKHLDLKFVFTLKVLKSRVKSD